MTNRKSKGVLNEVQNLLHKKPNPGEFNSKSLQASVYEIFARMGSGSARNRILSNKIADSISAPKSVGLKSAPVIVRCKMCNLPLNRSGGVWCDSWGETACGSYLTRHHPK